MLAAAYPAGCFFGAIPSGIVAARFGVKPTVLVGMSCVALTTAIFGLANEAWQLDTARFLQGVRERVLVDRRARVARRRGAAGQARRADRAGVRGRRRRRALRPGARRDRVGRRHRLDVRRRRARLARHRGVGGGDSRGGARRSRSRSRCSCARARDRRILLAIWLVVLPALLFGTLGVLGPLRLDELGFGAVAIGAIWLDRRRARDREQRRHRPHRRPPRAARPRPRRPGRHGDRDADPALARQRRTCSRVIIVGAARRVRHLLHARHDPAHARGRAPRARVRLRVRADQPRVGARADGRLGGRAARVAAVTSDAVPYLTLGALAALTLAGLWRQAPSQAPRREPGRDRPPRLPHRAARSGIATVAVAAPDDEGSLHARSADERERVGSYLWSEEHIQAALRTGADAIHPGYGFLAESGDFAEACRRGRPALDRPAAGCAARRRRQDRGAADRDRGRRAGRARRLARGARLPAAREGGRGRRRARHAHRALAGRAGRRGRGRGARGEGGVPRRPPAVRALPRAAAARRDPAARGRRTAPCSRSASASAPCSAATRSCSRRRRRPRSTPTCARA